ncbi:hypothetical protein J7E70_30810 [Variovorax paradoxus]|nr:hypothetical protein [Variovorax paradoxus]MBT2304813.1 hypothetical protein [Variovorax paradoxus]
MRGRVAYMDRRATISLREFDHEVEPGGFLLRVLRTNVCGSDIHIFEAATRC